MRNAAEQAKIYENSLALLNKTIKKNELTMKQLERMGGNRSIYVPLGRAYAPNYPASSAKTRTPPSGNSTAPTKNSPRAPKKWRPRSKCSPKRPTRSTRSCGKALTDSPRNDGIEDYSSAVFGW